MHKKIKKLIATILIFLVAATLLAAVWYRYDYFSFINAGGAEGEYPYSFAEFLLYLIGYGEVEAADFTAKAVMSVVGLFAIALLSSVFTISLFEWRNSVSISQKILVYKQKGDKFSASILLDNNHKDIYNLKITLILSMGNQVSSEEAYIPFISKRSARMLSYKIEPGTVLYNYLRAAFKKGAVAPDLVLLVVYTDISNGQEYNICRKYQLSEGASSDIAFIEEAAFLSIGSSATKKRITELAKKSSANVSAEVERYIQSNTFALDLSTAKVISAEDIDIAYGLTAKNQNEANISQDKAFAARVHMQSKPEYMPHDFCMVCINRPLDGAWGKYYELGCSFVFDYEVEGDIAVTLEVKTAKGELRKGDKPLALLRAGERQSYALKLSDFGEDWFEQVNEICFTTFYKDVRAENPVGAFKVMNCALEIQDTAEK